VKTVAEQIGQTPHLSPLLRRLRRLGFTQPDDLRRLAVFRGCQHYRRPGDDNDPPRDPGTHVVSNEELVIALVSGAQQFDPIFIRCAAQLASGEATSMVRLAQLAREERATPVLRHIARAGLKTASPGQQGWNDLLARLPVTAEIQDGRLPHPSRFVSETGLIRRGKVLDRSGDRVWLRPDKAGAVP
jgi:hypothetical protein